MLCSCAQQAAITGGEKDVSPPLLVEKKTFPTPLTTSFNSKTILLTFDEYVALKNVDKNFFVNPPIEEITVAEKGKTILITINESLRENTTYTFNFGACIQDITENNQLKNFKYVVSTGAYIDSNFFEGNAFDAFTKKPLENPKIFLFNSSIDTFKTNLIPAYVCSANEAGYFKLDYLTSADFFLVAIDDLNGNNQFDPKTEKIGFLKEKIHPINKKDSTANVKNVLLFAEQKPLNVIDKKYTFPGKITLVFNQKIDSIIATSSEMSFTVPHKSYASDTLMIWTDSLYSRKTSLSLNGPALDSTKTVSITTFIPKEIDSTFTFKQKNLGNLIPSRPLNLAFNHPIKSIDTTKMKLIEDSSLAYFNAKNNLNLFSLFLPKEEGRFTFTAYPGAINSSYGFTNDTINIMLEIKKESDFGSIFLNLSTSDSTAFIAEILKSDNLVKTFPPTTHSLIDTLNWCSPGDYYIRIIKDVDGNGKWSTGNFSLKKPSEPTHYYNSPIEIKPGWDVDISWEF